MLLLQRKQHLAGKGAMEGCLVGMRMARGRQQRRRRLLERRAAAYCPARGH